MKCLLKNNRFIYKDEMFICHERGTKKKSTRYRLDALTTELLETLGDLGHLLFRFMRWMLC